MVVLNKDMKDSIFVCVCFRHIIFVSALDLHKHQITRYEK